MTYHRHKGVTRKRKNKKLLVIFPVLLLSVGLYVLTLALSPQIAVLDPRPTDATAQKLVTKKPGDEGNRLYIPQINVDVAIVEGKTESSLEKGAWHRKPENGDPQKGGNFVLSAHRFNLGLTPSHTRAKSPFFNIDKLQVGDEVFVDYNGQRFVYEVSKRYDVARDATDIEAASQTSKLTLYSCNLRGEKAGREVIEALPSGTVAWNDSKPFIQR